MLVRIGIGPEARCAMTGGDIMWLTKIAAALLAVLMTAALMSCTDAKGIAMDPDANFDSGPPDSSADADSDSDTDTDADTDTDTDTDVPDAG
jgi:hypothetical protein